MVADELGFFRVEVEMALEVPLEFNEDDEDTPNSANGYYQLFGVTASSFGGAVAFVENALADIVTEEPDFSGWLVQLQADTWTEPAAGPQGEYPQDPALLGVHFISNRAFFFALEEEPTS